MLISETVMVKWNSKTIKWYSEKGYIYTKGDIGKEFEVKVDDLPLYSEIKVLIKCDYQQEGCKNEYQKNISDYNKNNINSVIHKDCCSNRKCQATKTKECNVVNYGMENIMATEEIQTKIKKTNLEKYGSECVFGSKYFTERNKEFLQEKYNVDNISQVEAVKIKKAETFFKNGTVATSRQQRYIHSLLGGELNYSNNTPSLDIAFPDKLIYIEVNGSGHDLCVKMNQMSQKEFNEREIKRYYYLKLRGWKAIFINSPCDYLPSDEVLINEYNKALDWFNYNDNGHSHYNIDIGNKINDINYGKLKRIKE